MWGTEIRHILPTRLFTFTKHTLISGKSGSGKSNSAEFILAQQVGNQKCIDLYDDGRAENFTYFMKENSPPLIQRMSELSGGRLKPQGFPTEVYMFAGERLDYVKVPKMINVCSIDQRDLTTEDLYYLLGNTQAARNFISQLQLEYGDIGMQDIYKILTSKDAKEAKGLGTTKYMILRNLHRWLKSPIFSKDYPTMNIKRMLRDKDTITSFSTYLLGSEDEKAMVYGLMLKKILNSKRYKQVDHKILVYIREISNFMGRTLLLGNYRMAQYYILKIIREGRDIGLTLMGDTQRAIDMPTAFRRQFGIHITMKSDYNDAEKLLEIQDIPKKILYKIPRLGRGEALIATGTEYHYPVLFPPAPHWHKKETVDVLEMLRRMEDESKSKVPEGTD